MIRLRETVDRVVNCKACQKPIMEHAWRDPTRCLECYLKLKKDGVVFVCVERDVRVGDVMPGSLVTKKGRQR